MENIIYNFLDNYFGDEVFCRNIGLTRSIPEYMIYSPKGGRILSFSIMGYLEEQGGERISLHGNSKVTEIVGAFFSIDKKDASNYIRNWFGDKHNLKKVSDIKKFIPA